MKQVRLLGTKHRKIIAWVRLVNREQPGNRTTYISKTIELFNKKREIVEIARISTRDIEEINDDDKELLVISLTKNHYITDWISKTKDSSEEIRKILNLAIAVEEDNKPSRLIPRHIFDEKYNQKLYLNNINTERISLDTSENDCTGQNDGFTNKRYSNIGTVHKEPEKAKYEDVVTEEDIEEERSKEKNVMNDFLQFVVK